jgi:hypothetical protein
MLTQKEHFLNRKHIIEKAYGSQLACAHKLGISYVGLYKSLKCKTQSRLMHEHICRSLIDLGMSDVTLESFWPEFYGSESGNDNGNGGKTVSHDAKIIDQAGAVN